MNGFVDPLSGFVCISWIAVKPTQLTSNRQRLAVLNFFAKAGSPSFPNFP
jgi:hypothetical protein